MEHTFKKTASLVLALLMLIPTLAACGDSGETASDTTEADTQSQAPEITSETGRGDTKDNLPDNLDFGGKTFGIWVANNISQAIYYTGPEEQTGDMVDDAAYERNAAVEERLNINFNFKSEPESTWKTTASLISKYILAGDAAFDVFNGQQYGVTTLLSEGCFVNCYDLEYIDFSQPWWNTRYMDEISISENKRYFLVGDYFLSSMLRAYVLYYNKTLYESFYGDGGEPQQMVIDGTWTFDRFAEASRGAYVDLNSNGVTDYDDQLGFMAYQASASVDPFFLLADIEYSPRTEDGISLNLMNDRAVLLAEKTVDFYYQPGSIYQLEDHPDKDFKSGKTLFIGMKTIGAAKSYRDMENDNAILPYPKLDEEQERYSTIVSDTVLLGAVPAISENLDIAGAVIEALCAESYRTFIPVWYETELKIKLTRDDISAQVIDIVHDSINTDFLFVYTSTLGGTGKILSKLVQSNSKDYASAVAAIEKSSAAKLEELVNLLSD